MSMVFLFMQVDVFNEPRSLKALRGLPSDICPKLAYIVCGVTVVNKFLLKYYLSHHGVIR